MIDALGDRMKKNYEDVTRFRLPRRTYSILRLDGRAFHTYTRALERPFDRGFMNDMQMTAISLCMQIPGTQFAYTQSDEISLLITDFASIHTEQWFSGNIQKIVSVAASIATERFNQYQSLRTPKPNGTATFDARIFTIPDRAEVANYFIWRQKDATRNSITMLAQCFFSHKELEGKSSNERQEMLWRSCGVNWNNSDNDFKRGQLIARELGGSRWVTVQTPIFTLCDWLSDNIPVYE